MTGKREMQRKAETFERLREEIDGLPFGPASPCGLCGDEQVGQRHRIIDAIAERIRAGDYWTDVIYEWHPDMPLEQAAEMAIYALAVSW